MHSPDSIIRYQADLNSHLDQIAKASGWDSAHINWLRSTIAQYCNQLGRLKRLSMSGDKRKADRLQNTLAVSFAGRLCGILEEFATGKHRRNKFAKSSLTREELEDLAHKSPLKSGRPDLAVVWHIIKSDGSERPIVSPGNLTRAAQRTILPIIRSRGWANEAEYNRAGRGRDAALRNLQRHVLEEGVRHFVVFDIKDFFPSLRAEHIDWMNPCPAIVRTAFFTESCLTFEHRKETRKTITKQPVRLGLPQGAILSCEIASVLLGKELRSLGGEKAGKIIYVDDGIISAPSLHTAEQIAKDLKERLTNIKGGPISLKHASVIEIRRGFAFLGYWIRLIETDDGSALRFTPSHSAKERMKKNLHSRLGKGGQLLSFDEADEIAQQYLVKWSASFRLWTPSVEEWLEMEAFMTCAVDDFFQGFTQKFRKVG